MNRTVLTSSSLAFLLLSTYGCLGPTKTKIVLVPQRAAFQDPETDLKAMRRRLSCVGARNVEIGHRGDTVEISFDAPKESRSDWRRILTRPGLFSTTSLVGNNQVPLFLATLYVRFGREVDLHPDFPDRDNAFAASALIVPERRQQVDAAMETIEFLTILDKKAVPAWGATPGYFNKDGVQRAGAELFLLPPPQFRGGPMTNELVDSAVFVPGSDSTTNGVELRLTSQGRAAYMEMTQELMGSFVAILVDDQVLGAAKVVQPVSSDKFWISGCGTGCRELAAVLGGGPVRSTWKVVSK